MSDHKDNFLAALDRRTRKLEEIAKWRAESDKLSFPDHDPTPRLEKNLAAIETAKAEAIRVYEEGVSAAEPSDS